MCLLNGFILIYRYAFCKRKTFPAQKAELANTNVQQVVFKPTRGYRVWGGVAQGPVTSRCE